MKRIGRSFEEIAKDKGLVGEPLDEERKNRLAKKFKKICNQTKVDARRAIESAKKVVLTR